MLQNEKSAISGELYCPVTGLISGTMNSIFIKLTGNMDRHEILDGFEFRPDLVSHFLVTCP